MFDFGDVERGRLQLLIHRSLLLLVIDVSLITGGNVHPTKWTATINNLAILLGKLIGSWNNGFFEREARKSVVCSRIVSDCSSL